MSLTDSKIRATKPSATPFKLTDSQGLYLLINPGGSRLWYLKYRFNGKESRIALGPYPQVSLSDARQQREGIRKLLARKSTPPSNEPTNGLLILRINILEPWRWPGIRVIKNGQRIMPPVCSPA